MAAEGNQKQPHFPERIEYYFTDNQNSVPNVLKDYHEIKKDWEELQELVLKSTLSIPEDWEGSFEEVRNKIILFINEHFENWFSCNCWPKNHNVEGFNSFCKKIAKSLYYLNLNKLGKEVNDVIRKVSAVYEYLNTCT